MKRVELLSPVGDMEMFYQAVHNGADAVYLAGTSYGARKFAKNFTRNELIEVIKYAHIYDVKVYVTVNTLIYEYELEDVIEYLGFLHQNGVDAVIMQDMGVIQLARRIFPNLEIHASTQCHNHSKEIVSFWKALGITRVVLARELSLEEIKNIDVDIEKEVFVYGALCVCYSGCCLFSSLNGGRSGNRGECVGSCRLPYKLIRNNQVVATDGTYLLSTKELNTLFDIRQLMEAGIASFKIEGRMKSPAYVGYVTRLYRLLMDKYYRNKEMKLSDQEVFQLKKLFNREFTKGYLFGDKDIMNIKTPNHLGVEIGKVIDVKRGKLKIKLIQDGLNQNDGIRFQKKNDGMMVNRLYDNKDLLVSGVSAGNICYLDNKLDVKVGDVVLKTVDSKFVCELQNIHYKKIAISMEVKCFVGKNLELRLWDNKREVIVFGGVVDRAIKREVTKEELERQLIKLGNTPFVLEKIEVKKDNNIFVSLKDLNELRREGIAKLICLREKREVHFARNMDVEITNGKKDELIEERIHLNVLVRNEEQLKVCLEYPVHSIYVVDYQLYQQYKKYDNVYYRLDRVNNNQLDFSKERLLVGELGSIYKYYQDNELLGDYYLNVVNHHSMDLLKKYGLKRITLSVELDDNQIKAMMVENYPVELIIYGRLELMVMKYCPLKKCLNYCGKCHDSQDVFELEDKFGHRYPMIRKNCLITIMHHQVVDKLDDIDKYYKFGIRNYRLELFDESYDEVKRLIERFLKLSSKR